MAWFNISPIAAFCVDMFSVDEGPAKQQPEHKFTILFQYALIVQHIFYYDYNGIRNISGSILD